MAEEQSQPRQDDEKDAIREITRELLPDLLLDSPTVTAQQQDTTTNTTTVSPREPTPEVVPLPDSPSSEKEALREITRKFPDLLLDSPTAPPQATTTTPTTVSSREQSPQAVPPPNSPRSSDLTSSSEKTTPRQQTPQAVPPPNSPSSSDPTSFSNPTTSSEKTGVTTPTEKEDEEGPFIDELERINQTLQQNIRERKPHLASSAAVPEQKATGRPLAGPPIAFEDQFKLIERIEAEYELAPKIISFQHALEFRYQSASPLANPVAVAFFQDAGLLQYFFGKISWPQPAATGPRGHTPKFFAVLGGPGSGKSTICSSWAKMDPSVMHIAIGDILRAEAQRPDSPYAEVLKVNLAKGAIGDPQMTVGLIKQHILSSLKSARAPIRTYLLDGFPRAKKSAEYFEQNIAPISKVIFLDIPETTMIERCLARKRADDNETAIRERIRVYRTMSADVIEHYDKSDKAVGVPQPCDSCVRQWMAFFKATTGAEDLPPAGLIIPESVLRDVTVCALFIRRLCEIRDNRPLASDWLEAEGGSNSGGGQGSVDVGETEENK